MSRRSSKALGDSGDGDIIIDQFEGRDMWPMTDAETVLFIMTVTIWVALAQVTG